MPQGVDVMSLGQLVAITMLSLFEALPRVPGQLFVTAINSTIVISLYCVIFDTNSVTNARFWCAYSRTTDDKCELCMVMKVRVCEK